MRPALSSPALPALLIWQARLEEEEAQRLSRLAAERDAEMGRDGGDGDPPTADENWQKVCSPAGPREAADHAQITRRSREVDPRAVRWVQVRSKRSMSVAVEKGEDVDLSAASEAISAQKRNEQFIKSGAFTLSYATDSTMYWEGLPRLAGLPIDQAETSLLDGMVHGPHIRRALSRSLAHHTCTRKRHHACTPVTLRCRTRASLFVALVSCVR